MAFRCCFNEQILYKRVYGNSVFYIIQIRHVTGTMFFIRFGRKGFETATWKHCNNKYLKYFRYYSCKLNLMFIWNQLVQISSICIARAVRIDNFMIIMWFFHKWRYWPIIQVKYLTFCTIIVCYEFSCLFEILRHIIRNIHES